MFESPGAKLSVFIGLIMLGSLFVLSTLFPSAQALMIFIGLLAIGVLMILLQILYIVHLFRLDKKRKSEETYPCPQCENPVYPIDTHCPYCKTPLKD